MTDGLHRVAMWQEIRRQPDIWRSWATEREVAAIRAWIAAQSFDDIWFCGAGTSAYIGDILAASLQGTRAVPMTDIAADPARLLSGVKPLIVSFGRSGNSTESIAALDALDALAPDAPRLTIICNKDGALATRTSHAPTKTVVLPDTMHDAGFAMTSSFSNMLLTALALFDAPCNLSQRLNSLADQLETFLPRFAVAPRPERAVYVGSGPLAVAGRKAALKMMELSAGQIPALWESTLGFRHGPKSFVTDATEITVFLSPDSPMCDYDADLEMELQQQFPTSAVHTIGLGGDIDVKLYPVTI